MFAQEYQSTQFSRHPNQEWGALNGALVCCGNPGSRFPFAWTNFKHVLFYRASKEPSVSCRQSICSTKLFYENQIQEKQFHCRGRGDVPILFRPANRKGARLISLGRKTERNFSLNIGG